MVDYEKAADFIKSIKTKNDDASHEAAVDVMLEVAAAALTDLRRIAGAQERMADALDEIAQCVKRDNYEMASFAVHNHN